MVIAKCPTVDIKKCTKYPHLPECNDIECILKIDVTERCKIKECECPAGSTTCEKCETIVVHEKETICEVFYKFGETLNKFSIDSKDLSLDKCLLDYVAVYK